MIKKELQFNKKILNNKEDELSSLNDEMSQLSKNDEISSLSKNDNRSKKEIKEREKIGLIKLNKLDTYYDEL